MKRTVTVNLNGRVFTMDEDAYQLLEKYLNNIRIYFRKEEGSEEIISDFEARIEELFSERVRLGHEVITATDVEEVISRVGKPDDFEDGGQENRAKEKQTSQQNFQQNYQQTKRTFFRDDDQKMLGGICSGLAAYFDWDVLYVRLIAIVLIFATSGIIVPIYLLAWAIFPAAKTAAEKLQMRGMPITVENIGKTVAAESEPAYKRENRGCLEGFLDIIVGLMKFFLISVGIFALTIVIIVLFAVLFGIIFGVGGGLLGAIPFRFDSQGISFLIFDHPILATISSVFVIGIPLVALIYSIIASIAKLKPVERSVKWILLVVWIIAFILLLSSGIKKNNDVVYPWSGWNSDATTMPADSASYTEKEYVIDQPFEYIVMDEGFIGNVRIMQTAEEPSTIKVSGSEFWVNRIQHQVNDGKLHISIQGEYKWSPFHRWKRFNINNLTIQITTSGVRGIQSGAVGNVVIPNAFKVDDLNLGIKGVGKFQADSLYVYSLKTSAEGVGSIVLKGQARKAEFDMRGTGSIDALGLIADSVYAEVKGIGSVKTNPIAYLKGRVNGIGSLTYKEEPKEKNTEMAGIGKIGKE